MGMISIGYNGNQILMHKMFRDKRGTAYSLFNRPFGDSDVLLEFIPNTEYTFDISGSENFASTKINLKSPDALINIMNHNHGDSIDPARDLTIIWEGGNQASKVAIQVMAHFKPQPGFRGPQGGGGNERRGPGHHPPRPPLKNVIIEVLENNPGQYTISAEKLQKLISESGAEKIVVGVSQFDLGVIEHDGKNIHSAMRNGTSLILAVN
jgi:hypothetical protein